MNVLKKYIEGVMVKEKSIRAKWNQLSILMPLLLLCPFESEAQIQRLEKIRNAYMPELRADKIDYEVKKVSSYPSKSKSQFDNDIAEVNEQWKSGESWYDQFRSVYRYSENREMIFVDYYLTDNMGGWNDQGLFTYKYNSEGRPVSYTSDYGPEIKSKMTFYYSPEGVLDSLIENYEEHFSFEEEQYDYYSIYSVYFIHHNSDSIGLVEEFTTIDSEGEESYSTNGYLVQKGEDMYVMYQSENYFDRYITYSTTFEEYFDHFFDPFFFREDYNDEDYGEGWIPYSRSLLTESDGKIVALTYELFDQDDTMEWNLDFKNTYQYENDKIIRMDEFGYFDGEEYHDNRTLYSYGGIVSTEEVGLSYDFKLSQNYPNPFNPSTVISYQLPWNSRVSLKVFDILGREVATLVDGFENEGVHQVRFDANSLTNGIYFYRIETDNVTKTKIMTLIK